MTNISTDASTGIGSSAAQEERSAARPMDRDVRERPRLGRQFWRMWFANLASCSGDGIRIGALPLLAVSLAVAPAAVAAVWFAGGLPFVLVGPFSGVLSDRWRNRRTVMWISDAVAFAAALTFALLVATGRDSIGILIAFNFLVGSISTLRDNSAMAIIPEMVTGDLLDKANSRIGGVQLLTIDLLGPPLGALLFALPHGLPFFVDALSFAVAGILIFGLARPRGMLAVASRPAVRPAAMLADIRLGLRWLWRHTLLRSVCLLVGFTTLAVMSAMSVAVLYAFEVLHVGRTVYVLLLAVIALGAVLGSLAAPYLAARLGRANALRAAFVAAPAAFLVAGMTSTPLVATLALMMIGVTVGICNVISISLRHVLVPADLMGRVNSSYRLVAVGMGPVGAACGGLTAELFGLRAPFFVSAAATGASLVLALATISTRRIDAATVAVPPTA
jgi:MFS family permease